MAERDDPQAGESMAGSVGSVDDHGGTHGHDDHGHAGESLGPVDVKSWGTALLGVAFGLLIVLAFVQAAS